MTGIYLIFDGVFCVREITGGEVRWISAVWLKLCDVLIYDSNFFNKYFFLSITYWSCC